MSQEVIETKDGLKIRKLVDLTPSTAEEYKEAIVHRVEHFSKRRDSVFNDFAENTIVQGLKLALQAKTKIDEMLGDNKDKFHKILENVLLFGL